MNDKAWRRAYGGDMSTEHEPDDATDSGEMHDGPGSVEEWMGEGGTVIHGESQVPHRPHHEDDPADS